jgi:hypothetical protein
MKRKRRSRRAELAKPRIPKLNRVDNHSVNNQLFECLNTITDQLQSAVELSSSLQALNTISTLKSQVTLLKGFIRAS